MPSIRDLRHANDDIYRNIGIARGDWSDLYHVNKFGYNSATTSSFETVWEGSNIYSYIDAPINITATSASGGTDNGIVVKVEGLDANYNLQEEILTLAGSGTATGTKTFKRIFRARVTSGIPDGNITLGDSQTYAQITAGNGQTLMATYTIPAGKRGYLIKFQGSQQKDQDTTFQLLARSEGADIFQIKGQWAGRGGQINYDYPVPLRFTEKTDIEVRVKTGSASEAGALFDLIVETL